MKSTYPAPYADPAQPTGTGAELGSQSRRALLIALLLGLLGAGLLMLYLKRFEEEVSGGSRVSLLTVIQPVERGTLVNADMLTVTEVPLAYVEQRAIRAADRTKVIGVKTATALSPGDTMMWSDLALSNEQRDLSSLVQPGKRAVSVEASETNIESGLLRPGDYVDVIVTLRGDAANAAPASILLLQRVLLLAVGSETQPQALADAKTGRARELTLSLKVEEAQLLALARRQGTLSVALRGPQDFKIIESVPDMPLSSLYDKTVREKVQQRREPVTTSGPVRVPSSHP